MHTVELLEEAITLAQDLGYSIRQESLGGMGGICEINGEKMLFLDISMSIMDQLDQVVESLRADGANLDERFSVHFSSRVPTKGNRRAA